MNNRFVDSSSDEEEEDEETRLQREEEEEQERLLSEQFGEAQESSGSNKRKAEEGKEDIEAEYSNATRKKARKRPKLTPSLVTGPKGLIRLLSEFPRRHKWPKNKNSTQAAAVYSRNLVNSYKSFCYDLFPTLAFQDVLTRIETFGSKKEVKDYLQHMREQVRNGHVEKVYGKEKAERIIAELQDGLQQQQQEEMAMDELMMQQHEAEPEATFRDYHLRARGPAPEASTAQEVSGTDGEVGTLTETAAAAPTGGTTEKAPEPPLASAPTNNVTPPSTAAAAAANTTNTNKPSAQKSDLEDSDDELEFVTSTKPKPSNPFADDDDEEEEFGDDTTKMATTTLESETGNEKSPTQDGDETEDANETIETEALGPTAGGEEEDDANKNKELDPKGKAVVDETLASPQKEAEPQEEDSIIDTLNSPPPEGSQETKSPQQQEEKVSLSDETPTIAPTMSESQLFESVDTQDFTGDSQYVSTVPLAQHEETQSSSSSDSETATVIATMPTQMESPSDSGKEEAESAGGKDTSAMEVETQLDMPMDE